MALSPAEAITTSFYAWELRGRGWELSGSPVSLEPPFRYCLMLPGLVTQARVIDDGRRPTLLSSLVDGARNLFRSAETDDIPVDAFEEPAPHPAEDADTLVAFRLTVPPDFAARPEATIELLSSLTTTYLPLSLEIVGHDEKVEIQLVCADIDQGHIASQLASFVPEVSVIEAEDLLAEYWDSKEEHTVVDLGLSEEFFLPLQTRSRFHFDPYVSLIPALANTGKDELLLVQVLFERVRNPWAKAILHAVTDPEGGSVFANAPDFLTLAKEKTKTPLFAVSLRVAAQGRECSRSWELARTTQSFFLQFARSGGNEFLPLENDGYAESDHAASVLRRHSFRTGMILSAEELAGLVHLPDASVRHPALVRLDKKSKALPEEAKGHATILGENRHRGKACLATLSPEQRLQHTWIIGASGAGKSTLLLNLILQDLRHGEGIAVLDPHGDLIEDILARLPDERLEDVVLFDPSDAEWPIGFNILSARSDLERTLIASDLVGIFQRFATSWGDAMSTVLGNAVLALLESPRGGTLLDLRRFLVEERFRKEYLATVTDEEIRFFWQREYPLIGSRSVGPILTRLDTFLRPKLVRHVVGQRDGKLDLPEVMEKKRIFLAKLSQGLIGEENAYLLGSLLVSKFQQVALSRQQLGVAEREPFYLHADEFQHFVTPSLEALLTAARKYRLGLTLAHQTLAQLKATPKVESALFGNAYTRIVFRTGDEEAKHLSEGFSFFEAKDIRELSRGEAVVRMGSASNDFGLKTFPVEPVSPELASTRKKAALSLTRKRYATPVEDLRAKLQELYAAKEEKEEAPVPVPPETAAESSVSERPVSPRKSEVVKAREEETQRKKVSPPDTPGRGGQEHKYLQHLVKRLAEERGFRALIEEAAGDGRADVVLSKGKQRIACEVSVTTDHLHEEENLRKCLAAGFERIVFIVPDRKRREKLKGHFQKIAATSSVAVISTEEIVGFLDSLETGPAVTESTVRGYKVKVTRQAVSPEELAGRRSAISDVIARSLLKHKEKE